MTSLRRGASTTAGRTAMILFSGCAAACAASPASHPILLLNKQDARVVHAFQLARCECAVSAAFCAIASVCARSAGPAAVKVVQGEHNPRNCKHKHAERRAARTAARRLLASAPALLAVRVLCFFLCSRCFCLCSLLPEAHRLRLRACLCHLTCTSGRGASSRRSRARRYIFDVRGSRKPDEHNVDVCCEVFADLSKTLKLRRCGP
eukprot:scaffold3183_cov120-Isochrysis_galbana.AAC.8